MAGTAGPGPYVTVTLDDIDFHDPIPERALTLRAPNWLVKIGRGTQSGFEGLTPNPHNAWFDSRVMSRSHAILRADPVTKAITVEDVGSMHGTHLAGRRLKSHHIEALWPNDTLTMGADVLRGDAYFNALRVRVTWKWSDESSNANYPPSSYGNMYRNTFSADYSEEDHYDEYDDRSSEILGDHEEEDYPIYEVDGHIPEPDDEVQVVQDSVRQPSVEIVLPKRRTFTVPESDDASTGDSSSSVLEISGEESPVSSPIIRNNENEPATRSKIVTLSTSRTIAPMALATIATKDVDVGEDSDVDEVSDADSYADGELDDEYSDPFEPDCSAQSDGQIVEPAYAAPTGSMDDVHQPEHVRAPSPSDAAMVKPLGESSNLVTSAAPPFEPFPGNQQYGQREVDILGPCNPQQRSKSAWAGHNSVLYDPVPGPDASMQWRSLYPRTSVFPPTYPMNYSYQAPTMPFAIQPPPPITIASLVQRQPEEDSSGSKKRKAEQISSDDIEAYPASSELASSEVGEANAPVATNAGDHPSTAFVNTLQTQPATTAKVLEWVSTTEVEIPPRKKAKKTNTKSDRQRGSAIAKMAAATITGMAIGAVGTIIGLAALPQDYFV